MEMQYEKMSLVELKSIAKEKKLKNISTLRKQNLINLLKDMEKQANSKPSEEQQAHKTEGRSLTGNTQSEGKTLIGSAQPEGRPQMGNAQTVRQNPQAVKPARTVGRSFHSTAMTAGDDKAQGMGAGRKFVRQNPAILNKRLPEDNLNALWFDEPLDDCVKLVAAAAGGDYFDAIHIGNEVVADPMFFAEGGAKNVARRDGMGTTTLSAATTIGRIPDYYFQAVGSGTGAIAAWEANMRLIGDGRFGENKMCLVVSQNAPFLPMYEAWECDSRAMLPYDDVQARLDAEEIDAKVLSNRRPPWGIAGGLYDALKDTNGEVMAVTNDELRAAAQLFEKTDGVDIHPAAAVAVASLIKRGVERDATVMLNITGGGERGAKKSFYLKPSLVFPLGATREEITTKTKKLFK